MPITKKDGTVYTLRGPNKIMKDQEFWDTDNVKFINMQFKEEIVPDKGKVVIKVQPQKIEEIEVEENLLVIKTEKPSESIVAPRPVSKMSNTSGEEPPIYQEKKRDILETTIYCLPIIIREVEDNIYEEKYQVQDYGKKFSFQGIIVSDEDMFCKFWTKTKILKDSIVYPKNQSRRWWEVQEVEAIDGGYLIMSTPTQVNPDFTD